MTHKCFKCDEKFPTSGKMVQHMRQAHSSFVEDAQMRIDRSQEISLEAKKTSEHYVATAKCPFCMVDCVTRRKLMHHLNVEHQDEDDDEDDEPELKVIRVENDTDKKLLGQLRKEQNRNGLSTASKSSIVNDLLSALDSNGEEKKELSLQGESGTIRVSATSIKLSEKRYRCFWCDASFRKRGKLMDHIDMFHKANKHQSEIEAELLVATTIGPAALETPPTKPVPSSSQTKKSSASSTATKSQPHKLGGKRRTSSKKSSKTAAVENDLPNMVNTGVCSFLWSASITEVSKTKQVQRSITVPVKSGSYNCTFFGSKDPNPVPPLEEENEEESAKVEEPVEEHPGLSPPTYHQDDTVQQTMYPYGDFNHFSPPLHRPQALYPAIYNSTIQFYSQQVALNNCVHTDDHSAHLSNYHQQTNNLIAHLPTFHHNSETPLDLTVPRF